MSGKLIAVKACWSVSSVALPSLLLLLVSWLRNGVITQLHMGRDHLWSVWVWSQNSSISVGFVGPVVNSA